MAKRDGEAVVTNQKVVWSEGMGLMPHHFQQWDRYYEGLVADRFRTHDPFSWGVKSLNIDQDALATGRFTVRECSLVMPDGLVVDIPHSDEAPQTRAFSDLFPATAKSLNVYLGLSVERFDGKTYQLGTESGSRPSRYTVQHVQPVDATTGENRRQVPVAKKNLQLLFDEGQSTDIVSVKLAELIRTPNGTFGLKENYFPPLLWICASPSLVCLLRGHIGLLEATRATFLNDQRGVMDLIGSDLRWFVLASAVSTHLPVLTHMSQMEKVHPESLYLAMIKLAGHLMMLAPPGEAIDLPPYQHDKLADTFEGLEKRIRSIIEGIRPRYTIIPLEKNGDDLWSGQVEDTQLFASAQFYVGTSGVLSQEHVRRDVPHQIIISSPSKLKDLVAGHTLGVNLRHETSPPAALPMQLGTQYFQLITEGTDKGARVWDDIKKCHMIALCVPESLRGIELQLVAVRKKELGYGAHTGTENRQAR